MKVIRRCRTQQPTQYKEIKPGECFTFGYSDDVKIKGNYPLDKGIVAIALETGAVYNLRESAIVYRVQAEVHIIEGGN